MPLVFSNDFDGRTVLAGLVSSPTQEKPSPLSGVAVVAKSTLLRTLVGLERGSGGNLAPAGQHLTALQTLGGCMLQDVCFLKTTVGLSRSLDAKEGEVSGVVVARPPHMHAGA